MKHFEADGGSPQEAEELEAKKETEADVTLLMAVVEPVDELLQA